MPTTAMPARKTKTDQTKNVGIRNAFEQLLSKGSEEPTDFDLPGYLKKQKADYVPIKRNIYLTKRRVEDDGIFCSCKSLGNSAVCDGDCHCGMLFSSCSSSCKCGSECCNKPFQHRPVKKVKLIKTKKCGWGIIADEDIKKGDFVIEYVGEVIDDKTCEERLWKMKHRGDTNFYLCEVNHDMVIDATYKGNRSRFINHSCEPNTEMQKWTIEGETRIGIFATRYIRKGDSLTYDYQFVQFGADQDCFCGAVGCRQKLGSKFGKLKDSLSNSSCVVKDLQNGRPAGLLMNVYNHNCIDVVVRIWHPKYKRYYGGVILDFDSCTCKHTVQYEDGSVEKVGMAKQDWAFL